MIENYEKSIARSGYYVALFTAVITIITFGIAVMTPPLSGPFCAADCFGYPYTDIASRFPRDYYWMYPTMIISLLFMFLMIHIHYFADYRNKIFSHTAVAISIVSAAILIPNYYTQLAVIQPSLLNGETDGIALFTQFNPHGMFIALEEIGFLLMTTALFFMVPVFKGKGGIYKAIRMTLRIGFVLAIFSLLFISIKYGTQREYIFEIAIISIVWLELILSSILFSIAFKRKMNEAA